MSNGTFYKRIEAAIADILNTGDVTSLVSSATELLDTFTPVSVIEYLKL